MGCWNMGGGWQACHQFLINVLNYVSKLVSEDSTVTDGEALGVIALQLMAVVVSDLENDPWYARLVTLPESLQFNDRNDWFCSEARSFVCSRMFMMSELTKVRTRRTQKV
jgi:hypothetical protein